MKLGFVLTLLQAPAARALTRATIMAENALGEVDLSEEVRATLIQMCLDMAVDCQSSDDRSTIT